MNNRKSPWRIYRSDILIKRYYENEIIQAISDLKDKGYELVSQGSSLFNSTRNNSMPGKGYTPGMYTRGETKKIFWAKMRKKSS